MLFLEFMSTGIEMAKDGKYKGAGWMFVFAFLALALLIGSPFLTISSINYLFNTSIPLDLTAWCAVYWLMFVVRTVVPARKLQQPMSNTIWVQDDVNRVREHEIHRARRNRQTEV